MRKVVFALCSLFLVFYALISHADPLRLYIPWPTGWELRQPVLRENVLAQEARQRIGDEVIQHLQITAVSPPQGKPAPSPESLKQLAAGLRDVTLKTSKEPSIPLSTFKNIQGYYFAASDKNPKPGEFTQLVEGVLVNQGYLINFTLLTNDATGKEAQAMIAALNQLSIR